MTKTPEDKATNLSKNLERYFATTPREQVLKDWEQTAKYDEIGITVDECISLSVMPWILDDTLTELQERFKL